MSTATASDIDHLAEDASNKSMPKGPKHGQGRAVRNGPTITPEATPEPEVARNEADRRRRQEEGGEGGEGEQSTNSDSDATANDTTANNATANDTTGGTGDTLGGGGDVIQDILKCGKDEHRKVLGIRESYTNPYEEEKAIEQATWKRGTDTHPKYNKEKDAQKAFDRVIEAAQALDCSEDWIEELKDWEGTGNDDDSDDDDDQGGMEVENETPALTPKTVKLYQEATTHIAHLQKSPKSKAAFQQLDGINDRIKKMNEEDGVEPVDQWAIDYQRLAGYYQEAMPFIRRIKKNPADDEANQKINQVNQRLDEFIKKRRYLDWKIYPDVALSEQSEPATPTPSKEPATSIPAKEPATPTPAKKAKASPKSATEWKPGLTEKGERIMAMAPTETTDVLGNPTMTRCLFLVEKKGEKNPIAFEDAADVGEKAARGYLEQLPKTERIDIRSKMNSYSPKDRKGFVRIKGVAAKEGDNPRRYPDCAVWVEYEDGSYKFPNRSGCRAIWKTKADRMIEDFFLDNGLEIPWLKKAKRPYQTDVLKSRSTRASSSRIRETPWRARSPERGRSSRSPDRRRSSSTSSSASYLSDEGLERLEGIEDRMTNFESKFEKMFMMMSKKIDALDGRSSR